MRLPIGDLKVMIPTDNVSEIGIREIIDDHMVQEVFDVLRGDKTKMSQNWNKR